MRLFSEHFGAEGLENGSGLLPAVGRESGFARKVFERGPLVPTLFKRDLRQKHRAARPLPQDDAVDADQKGRRVFDRARRRQDRQFDQRFAEFIRFKRRKARIGERRVQRIAPEIFPERLERLDVADAAAEPPGAVVQRDEAGTFDGKLGNGRSRRLFRIAEFACDDFTDEREQLAPFPRSEFRRHMPSSRLC